MSEIKKVELSIQELDNVAGGASRVAAAATEELIDVQASTLNSGRYGVSSANIQKTDDFKAALFEATETGK